MNGFVGSLFSDFFFWYLYIKKSYHPPFWVSVWNILVVNLQILAYLDSRGSPFFILRVFSFCMQMLFHTNSYVFSIAIFLLVTFEFVVLNSYLKTYKFVVFSRPFTSLHVVNIEFVVFHGHNIRVHMWPANKDDMNS